MGLNELFFQVLIGLFLFASLECGRTDHVHLKIHVPDIIHKHKHIKTKYVHVFHPKVVHSEPEHFTYIHSRNDPNIGLVNGGFPQPLLNMNNRQKNEHRVSEDDFLRWRETQQQKALEKRRQLQKHYRPDEDDDDQNVNEYDENTEYDGHDANYEDELYKKHKANKANSAALGRRDKKKHKNHNYSSDSDSANSEKVYTQRKPTKKSSRPIRPSQKIPKDDTKIYPVYGVSNINADASNIHQQYTSIDPMIIDPTYYSTLPKNAAPNNQDDIYSGLMARKYNRNIADKSKLLADINYSRKQQTKNLLQKRKGQ